MTEQQSSTKQAATKLGLRAEDAAGAAIAQSISLAAQNEVDALRNQNTVNMVAMGVAYAKWLQNPILAQQYSEVVNTAWLSSTYREYVISKSFVKSESVEQSVPEADAASQAFTTAQAGQREQSLPVKVFSHFLSPPNKPE